jgi:hypothetical protein
VHVQAQLREARAEHCGRGIRFAAYIAAVTLACAAAWFSIRGMVVLFPGSPIAVVGMAIAMESAKLIVAGFLGRCWSSTPVLWRIALIMFVLGLANINGVGVFSQLVAAHVGRRGEAQSSVEMQDAALAAKIDVQAHKVADLDRRIAQVDGMVEEASKRGRTKTAQQAMESQRKVRAGLAEERDREAGILASLKTERAKVTARGRQIETEAAPIQYVAELLGVTDPEEAIRWFVALIVLCCDPLAIALTSSASYQRRT